MSAQVIRLPTAAKRKVEQPHNRAGREARKTLRANSPWPGEYLSPQQREALKRAEVLTEIERTPALCLVAAIFSALDEDTRRRASHALAPAVVSGNEAAKQAFEMIRFRTVGEQMDLEWAMDRLREGRQ